MKMKNILYALSVLIAFIVMGCSDDDTIIDFGENVSVDVEHVGLNPGENTSINILEGKGQYTLKSTDIEVASATVTGSTVTIEAHKAGNASIIITSEDEIDSFVYVQVYTEIELEEESVDLFWNQSARIKIVAGNGEYHIVETHKDLETFIETDDDGSFLNIKAKDTEMENVSITVKDKSGRSTSVIVNVTDQYASIKEDDIERIVFANRRKEVGEPNVVFNSLKGFNNFVQYDFKEANSDNRRFQIVIPVKVDLRTLGFKGRGPQITYSFYNYTSGDKTFVNGWKHVDADPEFEVIKYDKATDKFWAVFYYEGKQGVLCMKVRE